MKPSNIDPIQHLRESFAAAAAALPGAQDRRLLARREDALERFSALGFPSPRLEDWKYTDVRPIAEGRFAPVPAAAPTPLEPDAIAALAFAELDAHRMVFVDGRYSPSLSAIGLLPKGVTLASLAELAARDPQRLAATIERAADVQAPQAFEALNAAFFTDGAFLELARGAVLDKPLHLVFVATEAAGGGMLPLRNLILAGEGSAATVVEHYLAPAAGRYFTSAVTEIRADAAASVEHLRLQQEAATAFHVGDVIVHLERDSRYAATALDLGGRLVRNGVSVVLDAPGAECVLNGLYVVDGRSHVDNHTCIEHARAHGTSREFYKGVLDGRGRAVFNGKIVVRPDAQHTDAQQLNKNLLLSEDAEVDTRPQLEIYADDVKCSHGATVGSLDADALFYLRSRAVDEARARDLLTYAFAHDLIARIRLAPIRESLERRLTSRLLHGRTIEELEWV
jgi:Fe-S cluster assembly protein SufD